MNTLNDNTIKPDTGVDIFIMQPSPTQTSGASGIKAEPPKSTVKESMLSGLAAKLGPIHFGAAGVIIAAVWIAWPYIFSSLPSSASLSASSRMLAPSEAMSDASHAALPNASESSTAQISPTQAASEFATASSASASSAVPTSASEPTPAATQPSAKEVELEAKLDELQGKLAVVEAQVATHSAAAALAMANKSKPRVHRVYSTRHRHTNAPPKSRSSEDTVNSNGFTLNTIYRDQAWIQNTERTYVVQEGDVIDGMRIVRVEPLARQVITSLGAIR